MYNNDVWQYDSLKVQGTLHVLEFKVEVIKYEL